MESSHILLVVVKSIGASLGGMYSSLRDRGELDACRNSYGSEFLPMLKFLLGMLGLLGLIQIAVHKSVIFRRPSPESHDLLMKSVSL